MSSFPDYIIRPANAQDKLKLQKLLWSFTKEESLGYEIALFLSILKPLIISCVILSLLIALGIFLLPFSSLLKLAIAIVIFVIFAYSADLIRHLLYLFGEAWFNWQKYWVLEVGKAGQRDHQLIGCAALSKRGDFAAIYQLYISPSYRSIGLGQELMNRLIQQANYLPIYLVCKPKMQEFYARLKFKPVNWQELPDELQISFASFKPDGIYPLKIMRLRNWQ